MSSEARFTTGSTMRHVVVMTATGGIGLIALFLVDALILFYISLLGQTELAAAIGFAGTLQFFMISVSIGLSIAATAAVSRAVGGGRLEEARGLAGSALVTLVAVLSIVSAATWIWRREALALLEADGPALEIAAGFLAIVLPSVPLLGVVMVVGGLLRAVGDGRRAMWVTLAGGGIAAVLDPIFIFVMELGVDGAAIVSVLARAGMAVLGLWIVKRHHDLIRFPGVVEMVSNARILLAIAGPAVATQLSTPFGNAYLTRVVAEHGPEAVAGWAVVGRLSALAFGGIFALSGAVGPILGQNLGAGLPDRIRSAYRDALIFVAIYVACVWLALAVASDAITAAFGITGAGADVLWAFTHIGAGAFMFSGFLFVSNAAFNNLGRATYSTAFNWSRDAGVIPVLAALLAAGAGPMGAVVVQASAAILIGSAAAVMAWRFINGPRFTAEPADATVPAPEQPAFASARSAAAGPPDYKHWQSPEREVK